MVRLGEYSAVAAVHGPRAPIPGQQSSATTGSLVVDVHLPAHLVPLEARLSACAGLVAPISSSSVSSAAAKPGTGKSEADASLSSMAQAHTLAMLPPVEDVVSSSSMAGRATSDEEWLAAALSRALLPVLLLRRFPKAVISVSVTVLAAPSASPSSARLSLASLVPPCVCAASLALADAGIDCTSLVGAAAVALVAPPSAAEAPGSSSSSSSSSSASASAGASSGSKLLRCISGLPEDATCVTVVCAAAPLEGVAGADGDERVTLVEHAGATPEDSTGVLPAMVSAAKAEAEDAAGLMRQAMRAALEQKPFYTPADEDEESE